MNCLREHYGASDLLGVMERFKKSQAPDEALSMLTGMQKTAPRDVFLKVCGLAQKVIPVDNWEKISAQLNAQPVNQARNLQRFSIHSTVRNTMLSEDQNRAWRMMTRKIKSLIIIINSFIIISTG